MTENIDYLAKYHLCKPDVIGQSIGITKNKNSEKDWAMTNKNFDVLIIGAGLSGIGAACHLKRDCPGKKIGILEGRGAIGGTWDLFRYPGIRSDSDMYTLGYHFKPWKGKNGIAEGKEIREYINEAAAENDVNQHIEFNRKVISSNWSNKTARWTLNVNNSETGETEIYTCNFLLCCTGYYNYEAGYEPNFEGRESFKGEIIHPQKWQQDYDYSGKKIVVVGSGATAVTMVPAMVEKAESVTMLQRSPGYVISLPQKDLMANGLRKVLPDTLAYKIMRGRNIFASWLQFNFSRVFPKTMRKILQGLVKRQLGEDADMKNFTPKYNPWDERLCVVPDGDLFKGIKSGKAHVVTDHIDQFVENGIKLKSGEVLEADIIVTATGLNLQFLSNIEVSVDGEIFNPMNKMVYRGALLEDLPNMAMIFGYTNASWTLKSDLVSKWLCRIFNHMSEDNKTIVVPKNMDASVKRKPFIDMSSGYIQRAAGMIPKQGSKAPWRLYQNYFLDMLTLKFGGVKDSVLTFSSHKTKTWSKPLAVQKEEA
jgi:cation diffusion facilitator CzcD-associated flavoprotein CzcO